MAEIILSAIDQRRGASERAETKRSSFKTPLTYRWLTRFRSMLSSATELNNNCACVRWTNEQSLNERQMERSTVSSPKRLYLYLLGEGSRSLNNIRGSSLVLVCLVCKLGG